MAGEQDSLLRNRNQSQANSKRTTTKIIKSSTIKTTTTTSTTQSTEQTTTSVNDESQWQPTESTFERNAPTKTCNSNDNNETNSNNGPNNANNHQANNMQLEREREEQELHEITSSQFSSIICSGGSSECANNNNNLNDDETANKHHGSSLVTQSQTNCDFVDQSEPSFEQLTELRWQPATDDSKYAELSSKNRNKSDTSPDFCTTNNLAIDQIETIKAIEQCVRNKSLPPDQVCPSLVRHEPVSSWRAQAKKLKAKVESEGNLRNIGKARRYQSNIEQAIAHLEETNAQFQEDYSLLDRAEQRDWPQAYFERFQTSDRPPYKETHLDFETELFRQEICSLEEKEINRSHQISNNISDNLRDSRPMYRTLPSPLPDRYEDDLAYRRLHRANSRASTRTDLLGTKNTRNSRYSTIVHPKSPDCMKSDVKQQSYLLCAGAPENYSDLHHATLDLRPRQTTSGGHYASEQHEHLPDDWDLAPEQLEWRLRHDDLHFRRICKRKTEPHEPPFGIPRQVATTMIHSTSTHYGRRSSQQDRPRSSSENCMRVNFDQKQQQEPIRSESRVSFRAEDQASGSGNGNGTSSNINIFAGRQSVDSGVGIGSNLATGLAPPYKTSGRTDAGARQNDFSANSHIDLRSPIQQNRDISKINDHLTYSYNRQHLDDDMHHYHTESPVFECHQAQYRDSPLRSRPIIPLENPRSKSPFLSCSPSFSGRKDIEKVNEIKKPLVSMQTYEKTTLTERCKITRRHRKFGPQFQTDSLSINHLDDTDPRKDDELECRFDFEEDEELDRLRNQDLYGHNNQNDLHRSYLPPTLHTNHHQCDDNQDYHHNDDDDDLSREVQICHDELESPMDEKTLKQLKEFRTSSRASQYDDEAADYLARLSMAQPKSPNGAAFSIGSYKSMERQNNNLKIL